MKELTLLEKMGRNEVPRRILGAVISVTVPGAGHVIIGHPKIGGVVAGVSLVLFGAVVAGSLAVIPPLFLGAAALLILITVASVVSVLALPPGPRLKDGLRALWPAFALLLLFWGAKFVAGRYGVSMAPVVDDSLAPQVRSGDVMLVHLTSKAASEDVVLVEDPSGAMLFRRNAPTLRGVIRGRALYVLASPTHDGRARIWRSLRK